MRFRPIPTKGDVKAIRFDGKNGDAIRDMLDEGQVRFDAQGRCFVGNYEYYMPVQIGDWVVLTDGGAVTKWTTEYLNHHYEEVE